MSGPNSTPSARAPNTPVNRETVIPTGSTLGRGQPVRIYLGPIGLWFFNSWGAHKTGVPNRPYRPSEELTAMLATLTGALWRGEVPGD